MKKSILLLLSISALLAWACTDSAVPQEPTRGIRITLASTSQANVDVKGDPRNGEDAYNENLLNSFFYFFYPKDSINAAPLVQGFVSGISETGTYTTTLPVSANTIGAKLFRDALECQLLVVANPSSDLEDTLEAGPTLADARKMVVVSSLSTVPQSNFVMVYDDLVQISSRSGQTAIDETVELKRLADKFTIGALVSKEIKSKDGKYTYTPYTTGGSDPLKVTFCNALNRTTLGGFEKSSDNDDCYFDSAQLTLEQDETYVSDSLDRYYSSTPVYTYSMDWEYNSDEEPYLLYQMDWIVNDGVSSELSTMYYILTLGRGEIGINEWYNMSAKLTVLGSPNATTPKQIFPSLDYQVLDWNQAYDEVSNTPNTPAVIKDTRYLAVPQTEYTLNNKGELIVSFSSSHDCTVSNLVATKTSFYKTSGDYGEHTTVNVASSVTTSFIDTKAQLKVTRQLNNTLGDNGMDISPIDISFRIAHSDDPNFFADITITQYPAIWVETERNSAGENGSSLYGYILIDGTRNSTSGSIANAQGASGTITTNSNNTSRWFAIIHVNQFDQESNTENFVVGDPRKAEVDNLTDQWSKLSGSPNSVATAYRKYEKSNGVLSYYHPTIPARSGEENSCKLFVAPAFRVCTAHCRNAENNTYPEAVLRCATYQEDGYPAGRWRLPTYAEIKLFRMLSSASLIPNLFYNTGNYTYAGGMCSGTTFTDGIKSDNTDMGAARCVYDEWYWSQVDAEFGWNNSDKTTFTWGDVPTNYEHPAK